ncbi:MAG: amidohydrolase family protein [bacterium]|nr:amidohydrolase family protein [bacterium]
MHTYDIIIRGGHYIDGTGAPSAIRHIGISQGRIALVSEQPIDPALAPRLIAAEGKWVTPGFLDTHTHYDAELVVAPALSESVRHGVTTVLVGSCSLSMVCSNALDASDLFTRVETVPREKVLPILQQYKTWNTPRQWVDFVRQQPLGPNLVSMLGHSDLRTAVMGLHRATDRAVQPTEAEMQKMESILQEALDAGFLGLSTMCLKWDKIDGDREWSKSLPSTYARWRELRRLNKILRRQGRVHQGAPNAANPLQIFQYLFEALGVLGKPLKTTLISMLDLKGNATIKPMATVSAWLTNRLGGDFRWQLLPTPFSIYADGMDVVIFEEFGAGEMALDLKDQLERNALLKDESYRRNFRKFYAQKLSPRVWQRDFADAVILQCPDASIIGRNFDEVARERGIHVVDLFLDLVVQFGRSLRWFTVIGNHHRGHLLEMICNENTLITFSDAGAHLRNMAFYNLPLRLLKLVQETHDQGQPVMSIEKAVWRLTGEQADWFGVDAGKIRVGDRADVVILDPARLDQDLEKETWADMENFGLQRMVNRNPGVVTHVLINGRLAVDNEEVVAALGKEQGFGRFLPALATG